MSSSSPGYRWVVPPDGLHMQPVRRLRTRPQGARRGAGRGPGSPPGRRPADPNEPDGMLWPIGRGSRPG
ncbi:hypothetical protein, partial [Streptomyces syringium]|uniref:hypothetical protein n=1 Tax=Streptomyces syringium TaxID=76729 RepID=UPI0033A93839